METYHWVLLICSLLLSAMFSGVEIAFISADKLHIEVLNKNGSKIGRILSHFSGRPSLFISTTLFGNTAALTIFTAVMAIWLEPVLADYFNPAGTMLIQTIISTLIILFSAEFLPKSLFLINPNRMLGFFAYPMQLFYYIFWPAVHLIVHSSRFIIRRVFGWNYNEEKPIFSFTDLNNFVTNLVNANSGRDNDQIEIDTRILNKALEFKSVKVRECMIPRAEIEAIDIHEDIEELRKTFIETGYSKILIYKDTIDDIIGYCHSSMLFRKPRDISSIVVDVIIAQETMLANELMIKFLKKRKSIALVVDEFGGTSGIVTMEDVIEEIFGEIMDEHDEEELIEIKINDKNYIVSARHEIDYLNDKYGWNLPDGDYETLGGLILHINEDIPNLNDIIHISGFRFLVTSIEDNRIDKLKLTIVEEGEEEV